jgi:hypothetical protein
MAGGGRLLNHSGILLGYVIHLVYRAVFPRHEPFARTAYNVPNKLILTTRICKLSNDD